MTLDTGIDITGVFSTEIEYLTPETRTEVIIPATVVDTTKVQSLIIPLPNEVGIYEFQSRIIFCNGQLPVLGRPISVKVLRKWAMPLPSVV